jgi:L,D-peptidoglycan transpeptidase YkuD (ErfK/YbiS/YcfS/YnhG family)
MSTFRLAGVLVGIVALGCSPARGVDAPGMRTSNLVAGCAAPPVALSSAPADVHQVVTVVARRDSTVASVSLWSRSGSCARRVGGPWPAAIGRSGLSSHKLEGDGSTPVGTYAIGSVMYGVAADPGVSYRYHRLICGDWWDEAPSSPMYNRFVHVPCGSAPPFGGDSEALWEVVPQYDYFAVIDYNASPIVPGRGSAIFLHISTGVPTAGCVALPPSDLLETLRWLRPTDHPLITIAFATT